MFRLTQHYAGQISHKTSGTCTERGLDALGPYTWAYGSEAFVEQSNMLWNNFSDALADLKKVSASTHASLGVFVSPLLFDIDLNGVHPHFNHLNFDFSCARIDPRKRLYELTHRLDIPVYDPTDYMRESFANRIKEGNFSAYYLTADENHVTPIASTLLADYLYAELSK